MTLEIPTFENSTKVNFYDTLAMLCNQIVQCHHNRNKISEEKAKLEVIKKFKNAYRSRTGKFASGANTDDIYN